MGYGGSMGSNMVMLENLLFYRWKMGFYHILSSKPPWLRIFPAARPVQLTVCELENDPVEIVDFPIKHGDVP